jgi:undecaprenyl-diphosphatase
MHFSFPDLPRRTLHLLRSMELIVLLALLAGAGSLLLFLMVAEEVHEGEWQHFDALVLRSLRDPDNLHQPIGPPWGVEAARDVTALGSFSLLTLLVLMVLGYLLLSRRTHAAIVVLVAVVGGGLLSDGLKALFARPRPDIVPHLAQVSSASFPSGHSMLSAVVYLTLGALLARLVRQRSLKLYFLTMAVLLTLLVGFTRVYLGVHYPTDVLGGWTAGLAWAILCWLAARALQRRHFVERPM